VSVQNYVYSCTVNVVIIFSFIPSFKTSHNLNIQNTVSTGIQLRLDSYVNTEKEICFQISLAENMFRNWCPCSQKNLLTAT
jgi:tRNA splicing ligase